jgi:peptide/nickel transport system permease protein
MTAFIIRRLIQTVLVVLALSFVSFLLMGLMPGDPLDIACQANPHCTPDNLVAMKHNLGLDQPVYVRYGKWLVDLAHGDLGYSRTYRLPVGDILGPRLVNTLWLGGASLVLSLIIAIPLGVLTSLKPNSKFDYGLNMFAFAGISIPAFWLGLMLIIVFAVKLEWLPAGGTETIGLVDAGGPGPGLLAAAWDRIRYLILPVTALSLLTIAYWVRYTRAKMIETMRHDYIRTARAKGLTERRVICMHGLRNAMIPVVTIVALGLSGILSGAVITETVFAYQGAGKLIFDSIFANDYNVAMCSFLITSFLTVFMNLVADVCYAYLDPRISYN